MADLTGTTIAANYNKLNTASGLGGRTLIVSVVKDSGDATEAQLLAVIRAISNAGGDGTGTDQGGPDAFSIAGIAGTIGTDPVYVALQGTGTVGNVPAGYTVTTVAEFTNPV
jgi:hypothetical protein